MKRIITILLCGVSAALLAKPQIEKDIDKLSRETKRMSREISALKQQLAKQRLLGHRKKPHKNATFKTLPLSVHTLKNEPESLAFHPSALMAGEYILTYIAGMPVVTSPYLGDRPAFDGSDLIVNISSINQDVRLMMQRNAIAKAFVKLGYPVPKSPIIALSGKIEPVAFSTRPFGGRRRWDLDLGSAELDIAAAINAWIEGYFSFAYDAAPPAIIGQRMANSAVRLGKVFINIGNLEKTPIYFTAGQLFVPFGRYSSSMVSAPLTMIMARTRARAVILGFHHQEDSGFFGAIFGFRGDTTLGSRGVGGVNLGYNLTGQKVRGEFGVSLISSVNESGGMQLTGMGGGRFGGFGAVVANERVRKVPAVDVHANLNFDAISIIGEWVGTTNSFRRRDLSFNGRGRKVQAANVEGAYTFKVADKPASVGIGYGWSRNALALGIPKHRMSGVFNISLWRDTVESIEFRHDVDYKTSDTSAGIGSTTATRGTGRTANTVSAQLGIYF